MKIVNVPGEQFVQVNNKTARDRRLTFRAGGLLVHLLSLPPWDSTTIDDLVEISVEGRDAIRKAMNELEALGYVKRVRKRNEAGQWVYEQHVHGVPQPDGPSPGNPSTVPPAQTDEHAGQPVDWKPDVGGSGDRKEEHAKDENTREDSAAPSPPAPPAAGANGQLFDAPSQQPPRSAENARATETTRAIYDARDPKPTAPFVGIVQIVKSLLAAGWTEAEVIAAGVSALALTRNSFEFELNQGRQPAKPAAASSGAAFDARIRDFANRKRNKPPTGVRDPIDVKEGTPR